MPPARSTKGKAAWAKARKYAEDHGIGVKEARTILARQSCDAASEPLRAKRRRRAIAAVKESGSVDLAAAERALRSKYPHIIAGTIQMHDDGPHKGRRTVEIACQNKGCRKKRRIHTSDAFQTKLCVECAKSTRKQRRAKKGTS